jgi:hypothetical protein
MKPAWDKLMAEFADSKTVLIADVDCTADGKSLCEANGVQGYPTIKHGDPASLEDYNGGRDFDELKKFASELKPVCSPANMDLCDEEGKKKIEDVMALSDDDIAAKITEGEDKIKAAGKTFDEALEKLQAQYQELVKTKDDAIAEVKSSGLGLLKSVQAHKKKVGAAADKEEL